MNHKSRAIEQRNAQIRKAFNMRLARGLPVMQAYSDTADEFGLAERQVMRIANTSH